MAEVGEMASPLSGSKGDTMISLLQQSSSQITKLIMLDEG